MEIKATPIFDTKDKEKAAFIINSKYNKLSDLRHGEIIDLAVVWCYYSGKIEGNTYSYVDTETLLKDNITLERRYEDAVMLKNLYNAFISVVEDIQKGTKIPIDRTTVVTIHSMITDKLLENRDRGLLRSSAVRIHGTEYTPPAEKFIIEKSFEQILKEQDFYTNPLEKSLFLHCNLARLQPFIDGNKRTSRLVESIVLMNNDLIPVYSSSERDIVSYRKGILNFYETGDYTVYKNYFLDKQVSRIMELIPEQEKNIRKDMGMSM